MLSTMSRRAFLVGSAALPLGCAVGRAPPTSSATADAATVRPPAVGQSWRYAKHDLFTRALVDTEDHRVASVGETVVISDETEATAAGTAGSLAWLKKYFSRPSGARALPSEIQGPWGMLLVDPHWSQVQVYETAIPLWPTRLEPGWHTHFVVHYNTADQTGLPWEQSMKAEDWEMVTVPAGRFRTLRYLNVINFTSSDLSRSNSIRRETVWFAPQIGRWVARESSGTYYFDESTADDQNKESSYRWELLSWT